MTGRLPPGNLPLVSGVSVGTKQLQWGSAIDAKVKEIQLLSNTLVWGITVGAQYSRQIFFLLYTSSMLSQCSQKFCSDVQPSRSIGG